MSHRVVLTRAGFAFRRTGAVAAGGNPTSVALAMLAASVIVTACNEASNPRFVPVVHDGRTEASLETYVYAPGGTGPWPIVLLSQGAGGNAPKESTTWSNEARYFISKGYVVIGTMRRGRGRSTGVSLESEEKNCDLASWDPGLDAAFRDVDAVIDYAKSLSYADASRIVLVGMSRGGFLSIAYAAEGRSNANVRAVINFVGGWVAQAEDRCPSDFNLVRFARYGAETDVPTLWLYGAGDRFYGDAAVQTYAD